MKKAILVVLAGIIMVISYGVISLAGEKALALKPYEYKIERGDNLTHIAKRFNTTKNELIEANKGGRCVKNENLIWKGCALVIPSLYPKPAVIVEVLRFQSAFENERREKVGLADKNLKTNALKSALISFLLIVCVLLLFFHYFFLWAQRKGELKKAEGDLKLEKDSTDEKTKLLEDAVKRNETMAANLKNLEAKLHIANEKLRLQEGLEEEAKLLKAENDDLVQKLNEILTAKDKNNLILKFKAQDGQEIEFDIAKVVCKSNDCKTEVSPQNALSHHFKQHNLPAGEPKEDTANAGS